MVNLVNPSPAEFRQFILDTFNDEDFEVFCADYFRDALAEFSSGMSLRIKALRLIEYCQHREIVDNLLTALQKERPERYAHRFAPVTTTSTMIPRTTQVPVRNLRQVFISHAHEVSEFAHRLANVLRQHGWMPWITPDSINPGEKWVASIQRGLNESAVLLVVLTPKAIASPWVNTEVESAIELEHEKKMRLIPLLKEQCEVPSLWRLYQLISFIDESDRDLSDLCAALEAQNSRTVETPVNPQSAQPAAAALAKTSKNKSTKPAITASPVVAPKQPPKAQNNDLLLTLAPDVTIEMVRIPAGEFLMGSADSDTQASSDDKPLHKVTLDEYLIGKYAVTNAQFAAFVEAKGYETAAEQEGSGYTYTDSTWADVKGAYWQHPKGPGSDLSSKDNHPVVLVSWDDAVVFCTWVSQITGRKVKLPSEAQWEKAARGTDGRIYPWGNSEPDASKLNYNLNVKDTTEVGKYSPAGDSPYGVADMTGNVWQWTADWYGANYYANSPASNPQGPASDKYRVLRGRSWDVNHDYGRVAYRLRDSPLARSLSCGFRVVAAPVS